MSGDLSKSGTVIEGEEEAGVGTETQSFVVNITYSSETENKASRKKLFKIVTDSLMPSHFDVLKVEVVEVENRTEELAAEEIRLKKIYNEAGGWL